MYVKVTKTQVKGILTLTLSPKLPYTFINLSVKVLTGISSPYSFKGHAKDTSYIQVEDTSNILAGVIKIFYDNSTPYTNI